MGILRWIKEVIFGKPEPEPPVFSIFVSKPKPDVWRESREEALAEWREEREDREAKEQEAIDLVFEGEWEAAKEEWPNEITDEELRGKYQMYVGW